MSSSAMVIHGVYIDMQPINGRNQSIAAALVGQSLDDSSLLESRTLISADLLSDNHIQAGSARRVHKAVTNALNGMRRHCSEGGCIEEYEPKLPYVVLGEPKTITAPLDDFLKGYQSDQQAYRQLINVELAPVALLSRTHNNRIRGSANSLPGAPSERDDTVQEKAL